MVKGLALRPTRASTARATVSAGGLEMMTIVSVAGSASSASIAIKVAMPPISASRSRPPTPIACEIPRCGAGDQAGDLLQPGFPRRQRCRCRRVAPHWRSRAAPRR